MQPPASLKALADPIYEAFYGLSEQPFAITTDPKFFYAGASHARAYTELLNGLQRREGLLLVTGETGTGKTTLARAVVEGLGGRTFSALVLNPYMSGAEIFRVILRDFGFLSHEDLRRGALADADTLQLADTLEGFLRSLVPLDAHAVIILDEAQSLAPQVLDRIRLLTALEADGRRLVGIILCGQPSLLTTLRAEPMYALNERITRRVALAPLPAAEVETYIQHRLSVAGGDGVSFERAAARVVADLSHGLPRRVNVLCDRALQEGRVEGVNVITADLVKRAARALAGMHEPLPSDPAAAALLEPSPSVPESLLTLGQVPPPAGSLLRIVLLAIGAIVTALTLGFGYVAYEFVNAPPALPAAPAAPPRDIGPAAQPLPLPSVEEISAMFGPAAASATPAPRAVSGQVPNQGNQVH